MADPHDAEDPRLQPWKELSDDIAFETEWFKIHRKTYVMPSGGNAEYFIRDTLGSVICVCVTPDNKILIEKQYRPAVDKASYDYPAGRMEPGEAPEASMRRELLEELGFEATEIHELGALEVDPGSSAVRNHVFLAKGGIAQRAHPEDTESIVSFTATPQEILDMVSDGTISCSLCVSATFMAFRKLGLLKTA